jgi:hypothetical protein
MSQKPRSMACALAVLVIAIAQPGQGSLSPSLIAATNLTDLQSVDDLKAIFNRDAGNVRLVLLASPT